METTTIDKTTKSNELNTSNDIHTYENLKEKTAGLTQDTLGVLIDIAAFFKENSSRTWTVTKNFSGLNIPAAVNMVPSETGIPIRSENILTILACIKLI